MNIYPDNEPYCILNMIQQNTIYPSLEPEYRLPYHREYNKKYYNAVLKKKNNLAEEWVCPVCHGYVAKTMYAKKSHLRGKKHKQRTLESAALTL